ncbi:MAG: ABC transporter substrate-binding protein [Desulfomicrobium apsheronum]|nr:ABC transporter substrate-binding protein [Desulfomicrobium apsheronum]
MKWKVTASVLCALLVFVLPVLICCERSSEVASDAVVCRLAYTSKGYYAPQFLASRKGWFAAEGVTIQDIKLGMSAGIASAEALVSGSADVAVMGDVPALIALASARDCVLVAAYGGGEKMHSIIVGGRSGISKPADLVGKRLGVQFGSSTHGAVYLYLEHHGIDPIAVQLVNMPQKDLIEGLVSGSIDALAASEPTPTLSQGKVPGSRELACLSGLGNDYPSLIVASREFADAHPEAIRAIVEGTRRAVDWINADPDAAAVETSLVTGAPASLESAMFRKMEWRVRLDEQVFRSLSKTSDFLHRIGKLNRIPDVKRKSRPEFLYLKSEGN